MSNFEKHRKKLEILCDKVLQGKLKLEEFYDLWPDEIETSEFVSILYDDMEDGVQHFPGKLFTGRPDVKTWESSHMYIVLYIDKLLLASQKREEELIAVRNRALSQKDLDINAVERRNGSNLVLLI